MNTRNSTGHAEFVSASKPAAHAELDSAPISRVIVIVLDSVGIGALPDAADYGDAASNTLAHIAEAVGGLDLPNLAALGLTRIAGLSLPIPANEAAGGRSPELGLPLVAEEGIGAKSPELSLPLLAKEGAGGRLPEPIGCYGRMAELSKGKDTDTGHWEMMGIITEHPFPTYPDGFPSDLISEFEGRIGTRVLGNKAASGTVIIAELGEEHLRTGRPIVYTSADSVFQIAAHEDVIPVDRLYEMCKIARNLLTYPHNVQRVIARPFIGEPGSFTRTGRRKDFSLEPPADTLLDILDRSGREVIAIGKIEDIFSHRGITTSNHTTNNADSTEAIISAIASGQGSFIFANLVDFDMLYGHRNDPVGYAQALRAFDASLPRIISALKDTDLLIITADHGCDPTTTSTDHSREYVPLLVYGNHIARGIDLGTRSTFCDIAVTIADIFNLDGITCGTSFLRSMSIR